MCRCAGCDGRGGDRRGHGMLGNLYGVVVGVVGRMTRCCVVEVVCLLHAVVLVVVVLMACCGDAGDGRGFRRWWCCWPEIFLVLLLALLGA